MAPPTPSLPLALVNFRFCGGIFFDFFLRGSEERTHPQTPRMQALNCAAQAYAWGKPRAESAVTPFTSAGDALLAELWVGTHVRAPSKMAATGAPLAEALGADAPWLFKILSVNRALSIQVHPDSAQARALHASDPGHYADPRHKPEMAVAFTPFEARCGFRTGAEAAAAIRKAGESAEAVFGGEKGVAALAAGEEGAMRGAVEALLDAEEVAVASAVVRLLFLLNWSPCGL